MSYPILTQRLIMRPFQATDLSDFTQLHGNTQSMRDYGAPLTAEQSADKLKAYLDSALRHGIGRLHVSDSAGFVGYVGVNATGGDAHPLGFHHEIGWRLLPRAWGKGYATEAAKAALRAAFKRLTLTEILAYTAPDNLSSQAVMTRLGLSRSAPLDFTIDDPDIGPWSGQVWVAHRADHLLGGIE